LIRSEPCRRAFAGPEPESPLLLVHRHQVNLRVASVPVARDARRQREVGQALAAPLLVDLAHELLECRALDVRQPGVGLDHKLLDRAEVACGDRVRKGCEPCVKEVVLEVIAAPARFRPGEYGELPLDEAIPFGEGLEVAADLIGLVTAHVANGVLRA